MYWRMERISVKEDRSLKKIDEIRKEKKGT
jgi:hypothetical protein